jgi:predicted AlkP superfamily phosphohydrolase/phosphomutase
MSDSDIVMIVGVDGLPHQLLRSLGEHLPTMERLMEMGSWGCLRSTIPYTTSPAWTTMVTGVDPGRHGIYDFLYLDRGRNLKVVRGSDCRAKPVWRRLQEVGLRSIIINVPPFYPAEAVNSAMIGSFPHHRVSVYPPELESEIRRMGYIVDVEDVINKMRRDRVGTLQELLVAAERRVQVAEYLLDHLPWNFFMVVFNFADRLLHYLQRSIIEGSLGPEEEASLLERVLQRARRSLSRLIRRMFQLLDDFLSGCLKRVGDEGLLILASDHGMTERPKAFLVNQWLRGEGYVDYGETRVLCYSTVMPIGLIRLNIEGREKGVSYPNIDSTRSSTTSHPSFIALETRGRGLYGECGGGWISMAQRRREVHRI